MDKYGQKGDNVECSIAINQIAMVDIKTYLTRKSRVFLVCIFNQISKEGIETYLDLEREAETEKNKGKLKRYESILNAFPTFFRDAANSYNEDINKTEHEVSHFLDHQGRWIPAKAVKTSELQWILKKALNRITEVDFNAKLDLNEGEEINILKFRTNCKNAKLRNIFFRLIHKDFFSHEKMFKFKMVESPNCPRCGMVETFKHLIWECRESRKIWDSYNEVMNDLNLEIIRINKHQDIYRSENVSTVSVIKMKIVQELIQIERPTNWSKENIVRIIRQIRKIEMSNAEEAHDIERFKRKWTKFHIIE